MVRTPFIPARNSRHRTAVLALYRALVKSAGKVAVPDQLSATSKEKKPLERLLRRRFDKNSIDTSPRLVFAAMTAGYKFLALLDKAKQPESAEYEQIIKRLSAMRLPSERRPRSSQNTKQPAEKREPLLIKVSRPGETPKYDSHIYPRPRSALRGPRRVPIMATTTDGQPFLRTKSAQPPEMSRMIGQKGKLFLSKIDKIVEIQTELMPESQWEDQWDRIVWRQMREEGLDRDEPLGDVESSYIWSLHLSRLWYEWKIELTWKDWLARGEALQRIVEQEQKLADEEAGKTPELDERAEGRMPKRSQANVQGTDFKFLTPPSAQAVLSEVDGQDIFSSQAWAEVVKSRNPAMRSWAAELWQG